MRLWEQQQAVRRMACEFRLHNKRLAHSDWATRRLKYEHGTQGHVDASRHMARLRNDITRELSEIRHIKYTGMFGPIVGDKIAIAAPGAQESISLSGIMERTIEDYEEAIVECGDKITSLAWQNITIGIRLAMEIISNPREYMTTEEQQSYDFACKDLQEREDRMERFREPVEAPKQFKSTTAVKKPNKVPGQPAKKRSLKIVNGKAVFTDD